MRLPVPNSGQLDSFGEAEFFLPKGTLVHREGIPARLADDAEIDTHRGNAHLMGAKRKRRTQERKGGEIHSAKAHRCVDKVQGKGHPESSAWAICTSSIGKRGVYAKGHGGNANPKSKVTEAREQARAAAFRRVVQEREMTPGYGEACTCKACKAKRQQLA